MKKYRDKRKIPRQGSRRTLRKAKEAQRKKFVMQQKSKSNILPSALCKAYKKAEKTLPNSDCELPVIQQKWQLKLGE